MSGAQGALRRGRAEVVGTWRLLHSEQRLAGVAALLVIVSTLGPFSFVEAAEIVTAAAVLALLRQRADRREFHLPFGDGAVIAGAGAWCAVLIATRAFDRPPGQTALALLCALLLAAAGLREQARRAPDDLPDPEPGRGAAGTPARPPEDAPPPGPPEDAPPARPPGSVPPPVPRADEPPPR